MRIEDIAAQLYCFKDFIMTRDGIEDTFCRLHRYLEQCSGDDARRPRQS